MQLCALLTPDVDHVQILRTKHWIFSLLMHSLVGLVTVFSLSNEARGVSFTAILAAGGQDGIYRRECPCVYYKDLCYLGSLNYLWVLCTLIS